MEAGPAAAEARVGTRAVFTPGERAGFAALTALASLCGLWFLGSWLARPEWRTHPATLALVTALLGGALAPSMARWLILPRMRRPLPMEPEPGRAVAVIATFVPDTESFEMLAATLRGMVAIAYPHDTWVLDEGDDPRVKDLCGSLGAHHFSRRGVPRYQAEDGPFRARTKYGNVNAWLDAVGFRRYEMVACFDPDHAPRPGYLHRVLGYFRDPSVGYVQAAQVYYNQAASFIARGAAEETYGYYSTDQMATSAAYTILTGCHNTHRVAALEQLGGFAAHDADDLLLTLRYRSAGWRGVYVPEVLAEGLTPVDWGGYLRQQRRWARSVLDIKLRVFPRLARALPRSARLTGLAHGLAYLLEGLLPLAALGVLLHLLLAVDRPVLPALLSPGSLAFAGALGLCMLFRQRFFLRPERERGVHARAALLRYAKWPHFVLALWDVLRDRRPDYFVTPKGDTRGRRDAILWQHLVVAVLLAVAAWARVSVGPPPDPALVVVTGGLVAVSVGLFASQYVRFPPPFDPALLRRAAPGEDAPGPLEQRVLERGRRLAGPSR
jgi:hypothetical protein